LNLKQFQNQKVLFIAAHPDDVEGSVGGTVALLTQAGVQVYYLIITNGDKGCGTTFCENYTCAQIGAVRQSEQIAAAKYLGVPEANVVMLEYGDAMVESYPEQQIRADMISYIRQIQPFAIFTWFPYPNFNLQPSQGWDDLGFHPDHQAVGRIALAAHFDSGVKLLWPNLGPAWYAYEFYMWEFTSPVYYVDITSTFDKKLGSYLLHRSQYPDPAGVKVQLAGWGGILANETGVPAIKYAEGFTPFY